MKITVKFQNVLEVLMKIKTSPFSDWDSNTICPYCIAPGFTGETLYVAVSDIPLHETRKYDLVTWNGSQPNIHLNTKYVTNTVPLSRIEEKTTEQGKDILFLPNDPMQFYMVV
jgi:hypothetical protein